MPLNADLTDTGREQLIELIHESLRVRSRFELFLWLQGRLQAFLPHDIMIAAWGDFSRGAVEVDILTALPGLGRAPLPRDDLVPDLGRLFQCWDGHGRTPFSLSADQGIFCADALEKCMGRHAVRGLRSALVHAVKDVRGRHDCLYVLLGNSPLSSQFSRRMMEALTPYLDCALRQLDMPQAAPPEDETLPEEAESAALSPRELEIMEWVRMGKTNIEIGLILDISAFTVKNHLQRIFRKLDVLNRAQAVSKFTQTAACS